MKIDSPEYAQMQRDRIKKTKPWLKTKGPTTAEGKERSKMNALKTDPELHRIMQGYKQLMKQQKMLMQVIRDPLSITFSE